MCNFIHANSEDIPETGYGYKFFVIDNDNNLYGILANFPYFNMKESKDIHQWINWNKEYHGQGFCIFNSLEDTHLYHKNTIKHLKRFSESYNKLLFRRVEYKGGLVTHTEKAICPLESNVSLVESFKILEEPALWKFYCEQNNIIYGEI